MPALDRSATVARIVTESPATARVFQKHRIDYCCHGDATVTEACRERSLDPEAVFAELEAVPSRTGEAAADDPRALPTSALVARIVARHHGYLHRTLPSLEPLVAKVAAVHGGRNSKLGALRAAYRDLSDALEPHLRQEEEVLFPALTSPRPDPGLIRDELEAMHSDHLLVGALLERIRESTDGYATPDWGCGTYRFAMQELGALEEDVLRHAHLENHVLMPRFIAPPVATD